MDLHPPVLVQLVQAEAPPEAPVEPTPVEVDVTRYIPRSAVTVTMLVTVTPPTGSAFIYAPGYESQGTLFKGKSMGEIRVAGPLLYVKLYGAKSFDIKYMSYREP